MTEDDFLKACEHRLQALYQRDNLAYRGTKEPIERFRKAPDELEREVRKAIHRFEESWDSEYK